MCSALPLWSMLVFVLGGLLVLAWSADRFVAVAETLARRLRVPSFAIGVVIVGFGTSLPELAVSVLSSASAHSGLSLGNAYGSNIFNVAAILGVTALTRPFRVGPSTSCVGAPLLVVISVLSYAFVFLGDGFSREDGVWSLVLLAALLPLFFRLGPRPAAQSGPAEAGEPSLGRALFRVVLYLALLLGSSHLLVWGSVDLARALGVSELVIGLTVVAAGTSLPELASAIAAVRRGQDDLVLGNIIGSNFFNTLAVVGVSGIIRPFHDIPPYLLVRDLPMMFVLACSLIFFGLNCRHPAMPGKITRVKGAVWLAVFIAYLILAVVQER